MNTNYFDILPSAVIETLGYIFRIVRFKKPVAVHHYLACEYDTSHANRVNFGIADNRRVFCSNVMFMHNFLVIITGYLQILTRLCECNPYNREQYLPYFEKCYTPSQTSVRCLLQTSTVSKNISN